MVCCSAATAVDVLTNSLEPHIKISILLIWPTFRNEPTNTPPYGFCSPYLSLSLCAFYCTPNTHQPTNHSAGQREWYTNPKPKISFSIYTICNYLCCWISEEELHSFAKSISRWMQRTMRITSFSHTHIHKPTPNSSDALSNYLFIHLFAKQKESVAMQCNAMCKHFGVH